MSAGAGVRWSVQSPAGVPGAVGVVQLAAASAEELEGALARLGIGALGVGEIGLRSLCGVDRGIVVRWDERSAHLMPHGGPAVMGALGRALAEAGLVEGGAAPACEVYPEAADEVEARMLAALARAASPMAVDVLLDQPRRWREAGGDLEAARTGEEAERDRVLRRLIDPPLVVAVGPANVGKSSLMNALAGRSVAVVADEPGTTRDHVGVLLDLAGLVVRYVDTPGVRGDAGGVEREAGRIAREVAAAADLVLLCGDAGAGPVEGPAGVPVVRVALRADLGAPRWGWDAAVSVVRGEGIGALVGLIRDRLVPPGALADGRPWRFWG